jgi:membrane protein DedA with SNARE-associated domain
VTATGVGPTTGSRTVESPRPAHAPRVAVLLALVGVLCALSLAGDALSPVLLERQRVALVALTPRTPYIVAAARDVPLPVLLVVAVARLGAADPVHFLLGRALGPAVLARAHRTRLLGRLARRLPAEAGPWWLAAIALSPTAKTALVAGGAGLRAGPVAVANLAGTVARVLVIWAAGRAFPVAGETLAALSVWVAVPSGLAAVALLVARNRHRLRLVRQPVVELAEVV